MDTTSMSVRWRATRFSSSRPFTDSIQALLVGRDITGISAFH
ncbi:hypothetical protein AAIH25_03100 [Arthrobacter crystallopoietes]